MPETLPDYACPLVENFGFDTSSGQVSSDLSAGAPRFELWTTDIIAVYQLTFKLTKLKYRGFSNWYHNTLVNGSKWFYADLILNDPLSPQQLELHFLADSTLNPRQIGSNLYTFTMQAVARNPDFSDNTQLIDDLIALEDGGYPPNELSPLLDALEIYNQFLPTWYTN